jgi:PAS domain S-box-containing protein
MAPLLFSLAALLILRQSSLRIRRAYERLTDAHAQLKSEIQQRERSEADRQRLAVAVTQAEESIVITDVDGVVQYVNPAFERHTGYSWKEVVGLNQRILKSGKQDAEFYRRLWSTIRGGKVWRGRIVNRRKDGESFVEQQTISPVRDESGTVVNFIGIKQDITRAEQLERQLGHAQRLEEIGRTAGGIAHNFNNLLTPILGYSEMLAARLDPATSEREYIDKVLANVHRARELISQIQVFGRKSEPVRTVFGLDEVVREEADQLRSTIPPTITLHIDLPGAPALVHADPSQIHSVVLNLAVNAVHAMPDGGHLWLRVGLVVLDNEKEEPGAPHSGHCVRLEVEDTGTGIASDVLPHIFEPFFTTRGANLGTGLGLATALSIVHQHGGDIAVDSELGRGTRFRVHLPASDRAAEQPLTKEDPEYRGWGTVLVVDDEAPIVEFCRAALEQYGYQVEGYSRPYAALRRFARDPQRYHSVVVDQSMPGLNGHQLVGYFRRKRPNLPCIVISGHHDALPPDAAHTRLCVHLAKPFTPRELVRQVASISDVRAPRPADAPSNECTR